MTTLNDRYVREALQQLVLETSTTNQIAENIQAIVNLSPRALAPTLPQRRDVFVLRKYATRQTVTTTEYTVPASRKAYILALDGYSATGLNIRIKNSAGTVVYEFVNAAATTYFTRGYGVAIVLSEGDYIESVASGAGTSTLSYFGWEEDAA